MPDGTVFVGGGNKPQVDNAGNVYFGGSTSTVGTALFNQGGVLVSQGADGITPWNPYTGEYDLDVNGSGEVVFTGQLTTGLGGVFRGDGTAVVLGGDTLPDGSVYIAGGGDHPQINDAGMILFGGQSAGGGWALFDQNGALVSEVADGIRPWNQYTSMYEISMNAAGDAVFQGRLTTTGQDGVFYADGTPLVVPGTVLPDGSVYHYGGGNPFVDDLGNVIFSGVGSEGITLFNQDGVLVSQSADGITPFNIYLNEHDLSVNGSGDIVFTGRLDATGQTGVFRGDGTAVALQNVALPDGSTYVGGGNHPLIDNAGNVIFGGAALGLGTALFNQDGIILSEAFDGIQPWNPYTGEYDLAMNDNGDIVFTGVETATGRVGVYLLTVPEPGTLLLLGTAFASALGMRRRRNSS